MFYVRWSSCLASFVLLLGFYTAPAAHAQTPLSQPEIEKIVHDYLLDHPEVLVEALKKYQAQQEVQTVAAQQQTLSAVQDALFNSKTSPIGGNPAGKITLVEFFDYRCPYCKTVADPLAKTIAEQKDVRVVYKEFPILSPQSVEAAKAALAAQKQGKYEAYHQALMAHRGDFDPSNLMRIAASVGLDTEKLKADMASPEIGAELARNTQLAEQLKITGTPSFVLGDHVIPGAIAMEDLVKLFEEARRS